MPRIFFAAIAVLAGVVFDLQPVKASEAPWCAVISKGEGSAYWDCQYRSIEECRPHVLGVDAGPKLTKAERRWAKECPLMAQSRHQFSLRHSVPVRPLAAYRRGKPRRQRTASFALR
jgi:hypothetical protein